MALFSKLSTKGQVTIPASIRIAMRLKPGDFIAYELSGKSVTLKKIEPFDAIHSEGQFWDEKKVNAIFEKVKSSKEALVTKVEKKINEEYPPPPFNTTMFLEAATYLRISAARAMSIAEELYMSGLISYPRTDNTVYPPSLNIKGVL